MGVRRTGKAIQIDMRQFETLCGLQCTQEEIAMVLGCSVDTLDRWCRRTYKDENGNGRKFAEVFKEKRSIGHASLRRMQWKLAEKSTAMAIWLGKQYLGQREPEPPAPKYDLSLFKAIMDVADDKVEP